MKAGAWFRTGFSGERSVWEYRRAPGFRIEVAGAGRLSRYAWQFGDDDRELAFGHFATAEGLRGFIRSCWQRHLRELSAHEKADYLQIGLVTEEELCAAEAGGTARP